MANKVKLPPQAIDLEEAVLGAMMIDSKNLDETIDILTPDAFYKDAHKLIFEAIYTLFHDTQPIDLLTVSTQLKKGGNLELAGGDYYLIQLTQKVASSAHIEYHARIILQKYILRSLIRISSEIIEDSYDDSQDVFDLLDKAESKLFEISQTNIKTSTEVAQSLISQAKKKIEEIANKEGLSGIPSGFDKLDKLTSGWQSSDLIIIAARPGMGKTAFVLSMARNMAVKYKQGVAVFSLEMANVQLVNRLIVSETELNADKIKNGRLEPYEWEQLDHKIKSLIDAPMFVDDTPGLSVFELRAKARRLKKQHDIKIIIIDYLQLMSASGMNPGSREQEVSMISRSLKGLAKELDVPILALSQLNRSVESREGKRPQLSDLRESGAIEQDADMVMFIHRPEYYGITEDENGNSLIGVAEIIIAKHRNGSVGDVPLAFKKQQVKFCDLETVIPEEIGGGIVGQTFGSKMNDDPGSLGMPVNSGFESEGNGSYETPKSDDVPF